MEFFVATIMVMVALAFVALTLKMVRDTDVLLDDPVTDGPAAQHTESKKKEIAKGLDYSSASQGTVAPKQEATPEPKHEATSKPKQKATEDESERTPETEC